MPARISAREIEEGTRLHPVLGFERPRELRHSDIGHSRAQLDEKADVGPRACAALAVAPAGAATRVPRTAWLAAIRTSVLALTPIAAQRLSPG